ncbi:unnamed protein product [Knipowitschia caucasica]
MEGDCVHLEHLEHSASGHTCEGFSDRVYLLASVIFQNNYLEKPASQRLVNYGNERGLTLPQVPDSAMQLAAYKLVYNAFKYQELLEYILLDSRFYLTQPLPDDQMSLVVVMLYDFQDRKFLPRKCKKTDAKIAEVRDVELHLLRFTAKFAASLARWRIKHQVLSIESMLPETVRIKQERASSLMLYTWVNSLKSSLDEVQSELRRAGFSRVRSVGKLLGKTFCLDLHCEDMVVFPAHAKAQLDLTDLLRDHKLIVQDKACCFGPNAVNRLYRETEKGDVLMAGCFSGLTVAHTASLIAMKQKNTEKRKTTVFVCVGDCTEAQRRRLQHLVNATGCKNVKLIPGSIQSLDRTNKQFKKVCVIFLSPKSSLSAISNPVEFILQEDRDTEMLQDLAQGSIAKSKLEALVVQQKKDIDHAMKFPSILSLIYTTYSLNPEENEEVARAVLEPACKCGESSISQSSLPTFTSSLDSEELFFKLEPTEHYNGCFMAVFTREAPQDVKNSATEDPVENTTEKPQRRRYQSRQTRLRKKDTKSISSNSSSSSGTSLNKCAAPSAKTKESAQLLLARKNSRDSQKSQTIEKSKSWSNTIIHPHHLPHENVPKLKESTAIVLPKTNSIGFMRSSKLEAYGTSSSRKKAAHLYPASRDVHKPTVISLPQVEFPALFPPHKSSQRTWAPFQQSQVKVLAQKVFHSRR